MHVHIVCVWENILWKNTQEIVNSVWLSEGGLQIRERRLFSPYILLIYYVFSVIFNMGMNYVFKEYFTTFKNQVGEDVPFQQKSENFQRKIWKVPF